ncbi:MAG: cytochrome c-type biogenesis CcmF C-terminal domain-containing protein, partial [Pseudomonadota bacterium]
TPFMVLLALLLPIGSILPWKRAKFSKSLRPLWLAALAAFAVFAVIWTVQTGRTMLAPMGALLASWLVLGAMADLWMRTGRGGAREKLGRAMRLPRADWGRVVAHAGFGITIFGIAALLAWEIEDVRTAKIGDTFEVGGYQVTLLDVRDVSGPNYQSTMAEIQLTRGDTTAVLTPESRFYPVAGMPTTEAAISNGVFRDLYAVIGDAQPDGSWAIRTFIKPFANWIWAGAIIMSLGGLLSLTDRRFRVAAGAAKTPKTVPAE